MMMRNVFDSIRADIVALDANDEIVALVEVKALKSIDEEVKEQVAAYLRKAKSFIPYAILVDRQTIQIYQWDGEKLSEPVCQIPTGNVLSFYDPEFEGKEVFGYYLERLVEGWLRDIAYHWKSETPPCYEQLAAIGLAQRLRNGTTVSEAALNV